MVSAARWSIVAGILARVLALVSAIVVARELGPQAFGLLAVVLLTTEILSLFAEAGISSAVVQAQEITRRQRATLYSMEILLGLTAVGLMLVIAPVIASAFIRPELIWLMTVAALSILIESSARHISAMLQRRMEFGPIYASEIARDATRALGAIVLVLAGFGLWSVVIAHVAGSVVLSLMLACHGVRNGLFPGLGLALRESRALLVFGLYRAGTVSLNRIGQRADQIVIAAFLTPEVLGLYRLATQLSASPLIALQAITSRISFSVFSRQQTDRATALRSYLILIAVQASIALPVSFFLATAAEPIVAVLFGTSWAGAEILISLLVVFYFVRLQEGSAIPLINGLGKPKWLFAWSLITSVVYLTVTVVVVQFDSAIAVAMTMALLQSVLVIQFYLWLLKPLVGPFARDFAAAVAPAFFAALVATLPPVVLVAFGVIGETILGLCTFLAIQTILYIAASLAWNRKPVKVILDTVSPFLSRLMLKER